MGNEAWLISGSADAKTNPVKKTRHLVLILGDQLDLLGSALMAFDPERDVICLAEVREESEHVWSTKPRTAYFLAAMRHFRDELQQRDFPVDYLRLGAHAFSSLSAAFADAVRRYRPERIVVTEAGDYRVEQALNEMARQAGVLIEWRIDRHFYINRTDFARWASKYKELRMEFFYRMMRKRHVVLMDKDEPVGGRWNFDPENRGSFGKTGPKQIPLPARFPPDALTQEVLADVEKHFADHPGSLEFFAWPVTRADALEALRKFIAERLPTFGLYQDAMWKDEPFLYHSLLSAPLNVKLLDPREIVDAAVAAYQAGKAPIEAVEGFVRQILGWREFMRGVYWLDMPGMREANHYNHQRPLPKWYWDGKVGMNCMQQVVGQTLRHGYAHHIQRLMVTGIWGVLAEISPQQIEDWYLAVYVDALDWVELPNVAGMAIYANGGRFTSKPYIASGQYIKRMSNYCQGCRYAPDVKTGPRACPVTTLYWNFLCKHETQLLTNPRTTLMAKNVARLSKDDRQAIEAHAAKVLDGQDTL